MQVIRQIRSEDASACCLLIHACLRQDSSLSAALRQRLLQNESPESILERARLFYVVVYESEGAIAGIAGIDMNEIRLLCVLPDKQHRGIGRALFEHMKAMVPGDFFSDIIVYASPQASGFYRSCGFREMGSVNFGLGSEVLPTVFMTLPLRNP